MDKSHPLPPLLGHMGGTYFLVRVCYQNSVRESKEQGKEKKREGRESMRGMGLPSQILRVPQRMIPGAWPWPCPWGALSTAHSCTPSLTAPHQRLLARAVRRVGVPDPPCHPGSRRPCCLRPQGTRPQGSGGEVAASRSPAPGPRCLCARTRRVEGPWGRSWAPGPCTRGASVRSNEAGLTCRCDRGVHGSPACRRGLWVLTDASRHALGSPVLIAGSVALPFPEAVDSQAGSLS